MLSFNFVVTATIFGKLFHIVQTLNLLFTHGRAFYGIRNLYKFITTTSQSSLSSIQHYKGPCVYQNVLLILFSQSRPSTACSTKIAHSKVVIIKQRLQCLKFSLQPFNFFLVIFVVL